MPGLFGTRSDRDADAADRVRQVAEKYLSYKLDMMPVEQVLDLLNPAGKWTREPIEISSGQPDPGIDPMTGCRSVTPQA